MKNVLTLFIFICFTQVLPADGFDLEDETKDQKSEYKVSIYSSINELPFKLDKDSVEKYQTVPKTHKIRIETSLVNEPSQPKPRIYPRSIVPINAEGKYDGEEEIRVRRWYPMNVIQTVSWKNGVKDGPETFFGENGGNQTFPKKKINWKNGIITGPVYSWNEAGEVTSETNFKNGMANGPFTVWNDDKVVIQKGTMKDDKRHGLVADFWPKTGKPKRIIDYKDGIIEGVVKEFYLNNNLKKELPFKNGKMHGIEKQYDDKGKLIQTRYWLDDEVVSKKEYRKAKHH